MPTDKFCDECNFHMESYKHFVSHIPKESWPRWAFVKGGKPGMSDADLDALGAPKPADPLCCPRCGRVSASPVGHASHMRSEARKQEAILA